MPLELHDLETNSEMVVGKEIASVYEAEGHTMIELDDGTTIECPGYYQPLIRDEDDE